VNAIEKVYQVILKLFTTFATELVYHP